MLFFFIQDRLHIKAEYNNFAVRLGKLDNRKPVQFESDMFSNRLIKPDRSWSDSGIFLTIRPLEVIRNWLPIDISLSRVRAFS